VDEAYWGKGVATEAVKLMEKIGFEEKGLKRIEILMRPENAASERVAIKCGYIKECISRKVIMDRDGSMRDACVYAKVI
jgi:ribosomal-protein-alanine N-acetyltransferase